MKLILGNKNYSSWSLRPWLLLSVHSIPFEEMVIPLYTDSSSEQLARNTEAGKVPVLRDGELLVWDSLAICEYVSERYLGGRGWPADAKARALARSCSAEMHSGFLQLREKLPMNCRATGRHVPLTPQLAKEIARIDALWSKMRLAYAAHGPWLFGEFSIADAMFAPVVLRFNTYGITVAETCDKYMKHVLANEKLQRWIRQATQEIEVLEHCEVGVLPQGGALK